MAKGFFTSLSKMGREPKKVCPIIMKECMKEKCLFYGLLETYSPPIFPYKIEYYGCLISKVWIEKCERGK